MEYTWSSYNIFSGGANTEFSVADFGIDLTKVEQKLTTIFHLAKQWGAILLLDEADVLLESRKIDGNLKRHLLVSGVDLL